MNPFTARPFRTTPSQLAHAQACINPVAQALLNYYPLPNANFGVLNPSYNYQTLVPIPSNSNGLDVRLDHNINSKQQIFVRYSFKNAFYNEYNNAGVVLPANNFLPNDGANEKNRSLVVSYNYSITPTLAERISFRIHKLQRERHFPIEGAQAISQLGLVFDHPVGIASHAKVNAFPTSISPTARVTTIGQDGWDKPIRGTRNSPTKSRASRANTRFD